MTTSDRVFARRQWTTLGIIVAAWFGHIQIGSAQSSCEAYDSGVQTGTLEDSSLAEVSGVAASRLNPGIYWTHEDSANSAILYALTSGGTLQASYSVSGANNVDWEDIAVAPCPDSDCSCIYIADIGDNLYSRTSKTVYYVAEPALDEGYTATDTASAVTFVYPQGRLNGETLLVDPRSPDIYVVTKVDSGDSEAYHIPLDTTKTVTAELIAEISLHASSSLLASGGSVAGDGSRLVIRTLDDAMELDVPDGAPLSEAFSQTPYWFVLPETTQGEAITYLPDGMSLLTLSENLPSPVYEINCIAGVEVKEVATALTSYCGNPSGCSFHARNSCSQSLVGWFPLLGLVFLTRKRKTRQETARSDRLRSPASHAKTVQEYAE